MKEQYSGLAGAAVCVSLPKQNRHGPLQGWAEEEEEEDGDNDDDDDRVYVCVHVCVTDLEMCS